jgi:hypothetical protein
MEIKAGENKNVFIDATVYTFLGDFTFEFSRLIVFLIIVLTSSIYALYRIFKVFVVGLNRLTLGYVLSLLVLTLILVFTFYLIRKYWTFRIITDKEGMTIFGLCKRKHIRWEDIVSLGIKDTLLTGNVAEGKIAMLSTKHGYFYFPLTMKRKDHIYPMLSGQLISFKWKCADGDIKDITLENCPLYEEIDRYVKSTPKQNPKQP